MNFAVELLTYHKPENKYFIGSKPAGMQLIEVRWAGLHFVGVVIDASRTFHFFLQKLIHDFLFPASKLVVESRVKKSEL